MFPFYMLIAKISFLIFIYLFLFITVIIIYLDLRKRSILSAGNGAIGEIKLKIIDGPSNIRGKIFSFQEKVEIGRSVKSNIIIDDPTISNHHASLTFQKNHLYLEDLGSTNGTYYQGKKITGPTIINIGDKFQVGGTKIVYKE